MHRVVASLEPNVVDYTIPKTGARFVLMPTLVCSCLTARKILAPLSILRIERFG